MSNLQVTPGPHHLIMLSAKTDTALVNRTKQLVKYLKENPEVKLADVAFTLQVGRQDMNQRQFFVCRDLDNAVKILDSLDPKRILKRKTDTSDPPIVFMFPGASLSIREHGIRTLQNRIKISRTRSISARRYFSLIFL